ncbi:hypothetical protein [Methanoregula sp.]|uniref:hypothetical protein n=1 Tax=Methanoregula sp. TaxID=2052170 RepID=UPI00236F45CC|nr:hypothetical protein [Methanoregula sp.]MDD1685812.1 hypothetical protein [Methanoregula sp.]
MSPVPQPMDKTVKPDRTIPLEQIVAGEIATAECERQAFRLHREPAAIEAAILLLCILVNVGYSGIRNDYLLLFVAASLYLNMFYFITLLVPTSPGAIALRKPEIAKFHAWLAENGITSGTRQFTRIFVNTIFMNSRTLTRGFCMIFAVDIVFTIIAYFYGLPSDIALFVITQSAVILLFYGLVWKIEPFTAEFARNIDLVRDRLSRDLPPAIISLLFLTGFLTIVFLFITTIILLPGITLNAFLTGSGLSELAHMFLLLGVLVVSQYFIIRYIHGKTSRVMAERLLDYREELLRSLERDLEQGSTSGHDTDVKSRYEMTTRLMESRIYRIQRNSLLGTFPVYVVDLDFSVIMDTTTLTAIKGYITEKQ